jgi:hypothetical protein
MSKSRKIFALATAILMACSNSSLYAADMPARKGLQIPPPPDRCTSDPKSPNAKRVYVSRVGANGGDAVEFAFYRPMPKKVWCFVYDDVGKVESQCTKTETTVCGIYSYIEIHAGCYGCDAPDGWYWINWHNQDMKNTRIFIIEVEY